MRCQEPAAAPPVAAQQPAVNPNPAAVPGLAAPQPGAPPPSWAQGRPDSPAAANIAPVSPPPIPTAADKLPVARLKLPANFHIEVYATGLSDARSLRVDDKGNVFVSTYGAVSYHLKTSHNPNAGKPRGELC